MSLDELRRKIDEIDTRIVALLNERYQTVIEIGRQKKNSLGAIYVPEREKIVFEKVAALNRGPMSQTTLRAVYREIMSGALALEHPLNIAYLGPEGSFTHLAAVSKFGHSVAYVPKGNIDDIFSDVHNGRADYGCVPVENSTEGVVSHTLDIFVNSDAKICAEIISEYAPIYKARFVATAACRRAKNCREFLAEVKRETGLSLEIISSQEESRLAVIGCLPLLKRGVKRVLVFDIGGGSTEVSLARVHGGRASVEGYISLPYGVVTVAEAFPNKEMTNLAYDTVMERTHKLLEAFEERYHISEAVKNGEIQVIGTSGTVTVLGAVQLNLKRYNRSAVDGLVINAADIGRSVGKIRRMGDEGRKKHPCIGPLKADLTIAGCAIIEAICSFWPVREITVADRGIREGILLDMMHSRHRPRRRFFHRGANKRKEKNETAISGRH